MRQGLQLIFENVFVIVVILSYVYLFVCIAFKGRAHMLQLIISYIITVAVYFDPLGKIPIYGYRRLLYVGVWLFLTLWNFERL